jgi:hypothetical protein
MFKGEPNDRRLGEGVGDSVAVQSKPKRMYRTQEGDVGTESL